MQEQQDFFSFAAEIGLTKHFGGKEATEKLAELCHIGKNMYVLDIGCGVGVTSCFLAKKYDCSVVGIDIREKMVERSREKALREDLQDQVEFRVADAQNLPFENNLFDVVLTESVTAFTQDKERAIHEYVRVTKPGGYIGLNESTWLEYPPPPDILAWVSQDIGSNAMPSSINEWQKLLEDADLKNITVEMDKLDLKNESKGILQRYGWGGILSIFWRMIRLYQKNPSYRKFVRETRESGVIPENIDRYLGYGFYVGQK